MAVTYFQRSDTSDLTGPTGTGGTTRHLVASRTAGGATFDLATGNMNAGLLCNQNFFTPATDPGLNGQVGNHTVAVRVTVQNVNIGIRVFLGRVNASGILQGSEVQAAEGSQTAGAASRTFTWTAANLGIWQAGHRLRIRVELTNTSGSMNQSATIAVDTSADTIATPFDDTAAGDFTVAVATSATTVDGTSHTVALPDGSNVPGRRVVVWFAKDGTTGTITWPTSPAFTQFQSGSGTDTQLALAYRDIDGTEGFSGTGDTITVTTSASEQSDHNAYLISAGHDPTTPPEAATPATGLSATPDPPSLTPTWGAEANLWIAGAALRFNGQYTDKPTNYTNLLNGPGTGDTNAPLGTARRELSATSEDPGTFTQNGGSMAWIATTAAVRPAGAGGDATATPAVIAASASVPQTVVSVAAAATVVPTVSTLPQPTVSVGSAPAVTQAVVALPQATPDTGGGNATATPVVISAPAALPQAAVGVATTPAVTATTTTLPDLDVSVGAAPAVTPLVTALPQAVPDTGGGNATALPAAIAATTVSPQATVSVGTAPAVTAATVTLPAAGVGITELVDTIPATTTMPLAVPQVGAGPATIATTASVGDSDVSVGVAPGTITVVTTLPLVEFVGDVAADINPVTATVRDTGHTVTVRDSGHTATAREMH